MYRAAEKSSYTGESKKSVIVPNNSFKSVADFVEDNLVVPKLLYFGLHAIIYSTHAFLFQYVRDTWFITKSEYSLTNLAQFTNIAGSFFFSRLADRTGKYRLILAGCVAAYCLCICLLLFPVMLPTTHQHISDYSETTILDDPLRVYRLRVHLLIRAVSFFFIAGVSPLLDSMVIKKLSSSPNLSKTLFGRQRLWGTVGQCMIGIIVHCIYDFADKNLKVIFHILIVNSILFISLIFSSIPDDLNFSVRSSQNQQSSHDSSDFKGSSAGTFIDSRANTSARSRHNSTDLITSPGFFVLLLTVLSAGFIHSILIINRVNFVTDELFYYKSAASNPIFVRVLPECLFYFFKEIIEWFGIYWVLVIGNIAGVIRVYFYAIAPSGQITFDHPRGTIKPQTWVIYYIYALECLGAVSATHVISSAALLASGMAPDGMASTAQGLVSGSWQGLSTSLAAVFGAVILKYFHLKIFTMFTLTSFIGGIFVILIFFKFALIDRVIFTSSRKFVS